MDTRTDTSRRKYNPYHLLDEACNFQPILTEAASTAAVLFDAPQAHVLYRYPRSPILGRYGLLYLAHLTVRCSATVC